MTTREYISALADLLNSSKDERERAERIADANWKLFKECVGGSRTQAKLALAEAASQLEHAHRPRRRGSPTGRPKKTDVVEGTET